MILLGICAFMIGASFFIVNALLWYRMAKEEYREPFHALCPETLEAVEIRIDGTRAARTRFHGREELVVIGCSRWPGRAACDQACTPEVPFLGTSCANREIAVFGSQPGWSQRLEMTPELLAKLKTS